MSPDVYDALRAHIAASFSVIPVLYENEFTEAPGLQPFAMLEVSSTTYEQMTVGARTQAENRFDEDGSFFVHIMVPAGSGVRDAFAYARAMADVFRGVTLMNGAVEFEDVIVGFGTRDDDGNFYRVSVNVGWRMTESPET